MRPDCWKWPCLSLLRLAEFSLPACTADRAAGATLASLCPGASHRCERSSESESAEAAAEPVLHRHTAKACVPANGDCCRACTTAFQPHSISTLDPGLNPDQQPCAARNKADTVLPVVITSYEIVIADSKQLQKYEWRYVVVDEGHRLKNNNCRLLRELNMLPTGNKLLLTGVLPLPAWHRSRSTLSS